MKSVNEITIKYKASKNCNLNIFNSEFVKNNSENCKIVYENNTYNLSEYFDLKNIQIADELEIKLTGINNIKDASHMFQKCTSLIEIPDICYWDVINLKDISNMFYGCTSLSEAPDISNWNTENIENMSNLFN